jgi:hypothetical protein
VRLIFEADKHRVSSRGGLYAFCVLDDMLRMVMSSIMRCRNGEITLVMEAPVDRIALQSLKTGS